MRKLFFGVVSLGALAAILSACSVSILNAIIPRGGYTIHKDVAYGTDARQTLDIYVPDHLEKPAPVIVFFYGGSWQEGDKASYLFVGQAFASKGYVVVIADYRVYPQVSFPVFLEDSASAFAWTHAHIANYSGDPASMFLAGHSAGAYNAVMLASDTKYLKAAGASESWVKGVIGISGPYDFLPFTDPKIIALFSTSPGPATQPINYIHPGMPPMFLATGDEDTMVYPKNTNHLTDKLISNGDSVEKHIYPGIGHIGAALSLANGFRYKAPMLEDISRFVSKVTSGATVAP